MIKHQNHGKKFNDQVQQTLQVECIEDNATPKRLKEEHTFFKRASILSLNGAITLRFGAS